jgi:hypothetical protein
LVAILSRGWVRDSSRLAEGTLRFEIASGHLVGFSEPILGAIL